MATLGTPVPVVFFNIPVSKELINLPLIPLTVNTVLPVASPVWVALETNPEYKLFTALSPVLVPLILFNVATLVFNPLRLVAVTAEPADEDEIA